MKFSMTGLLEGRGYPAAQKMLYQDVRNAMASQWKLEIRKPVVLGFVPANDLNRE